MNCKHCPRDAHNNGTEMAMKVVRQARLEHSGGSTPDQLRAQGCLLVLVEGSKARGQ